MQQQQVLVLLVFVASFSSVNVVNSELIRDACGPGWDAPSSQPKWCYKFVFDQSVSYDWYLARQYCKLQNSELLVIDDDDEADWLTEVLTSRTHMTGFHAADSKAVGWFADAHKGLYCANLLPCWRNGKPLTSLDSMELIEGADYRQCDNLLLFNTPSCYYLQFSDFSITAMSVTCASRHKNVGLVCKKAAQPVLDTPAQSCSHADAQSIPCPTGWSKPNFELTAAPYCYKFVSSGAVSWDSAYSQCKAEKAELLFLENSHETRWVVGTAASLVNVNSADQRYAVDAHQFMHTYGRWSFAGGLPILISNLLSIGLHLGYCNNEHCAELSSSVNNYDLALKPIPCSTTNDWKLGYICKKPVCEVPYKSSQNVTFKTDHRRSDM